MPYLEKKFIGNETIIISSIPSDNGTTPTGSLSGSNATLLWNTDYRITYDHNPTSIETTAPSGFTPTYPGFDAAGDPDDLFSNANSTTTSDLNLDDGLI